MGLLLALLFLCACGRGAKPDDATLRIAMSRGGGNEINVLNYTGDFAAKTLVFEGLTTLDENREVVGVLAESWDVSDDGRTYDLRLREGIEFHDGTLLDAAAVVAHFRRWIGVKKHKWFGSTKRIVSVEAKGPRKVMVVLDRPYYPFLQELGFVNPTLIMAPSSFDDAGAFKEPVGTGPFRVVEHRKDERIVFERFEKYRGPKPGVKRLVWKVVPDGQTRILALKAGEVDLLDDGWLGQIPREHVEALRAGPSVALIEEPGTVTRIIVFNLRDEKFEDLRVRRALNHAVDRRALVDAVCEGFADPARSIFPPNIPYGPVDVPGYPHDPGRARTLLDEAGWRDGDGNGWREWKGEEIVLDFVVKVKEAEERSIALVVQDQLKKVGVKVRIREIEPGVHESRLKEYRFDLGLYFNWGLPYDPHSYLVGRLHGTAPEDTGARTIFTIYASADLDAMIDALIASTDETGRKALYGRIHRLLHDRAVAVPLFTNRRIAAFRSWVKGYRFGPTPYTLDLAGVVIEGRK